LHEYVYNYGDTPIAMVWWGHSGERREAILEPGASAYVRPLVRHAFHLCNGDDAQTAAGASLLVVRVPGLVTQDALDEYAAAGPARARALHETDRWF
jgi:methylphosphonate synthase